MKLLFVLFFLFFHLIAWDFKDFKEEISVPVTTDAIDVTLYGTATTLVVLTFEDQLEDPVQKEAVRAKPLGASTTYGNLIGLGYPNLLYVIGQGIAGASGDTKGYERSLSMLKASLYASSVTHVLKLAVHEQRPDNKHQRDSFPSAHSTLAFAFGGYVFEEHGWEWGVPALLMSSFSAASRINDNRHYLHDVLAGTTIGMAYGVGISKHNKKKEKLSYMLIPLIDSQTRGVALIKDF